MPAPRAAFLSVVSIVAFAACRVSTQQNELYEGDQMADSASTTSRSSSRTASTPIDASNGEGAEASVDAATDADAGGSAPPPCTTQTMSTNAPETTCAPDSYALSGGTLPLGAFHLTRWADEEKGCATYGSVRQGTMTIEDVGGTLFMRWILIVDGQTTWGTYELARKGPTAFMRTEVCNWTPQTPAVLASYASTSNEILFVHDHGQERWVRIPKAPPPDSPPIDDPVFN